MSSTVQENNKALVRRFFEEVYHLGNLDVADEVLAPNFLDYDVVPGKVVNKIMGSGIHDLKEFRGVAPSGARLTIEFVTINRVVEGKIVEARHTGNTASLWQQRLQQERIERERVEQELQVARRIQQTSLPKGVPTLEGWQITTYYQAAREVGGDFYDFLELDDGRLGI